MDDRISERLLQFRVRKGLSQEELAIKLNVSRQSISNWENGTSSPSIEFIIELAKIYEVSVDDLLNVNKPIEDCYKKEEKIDAEIIDNDEQVHIGKEGIHIKDGKDEVHISWSDGIHIKSYDENDELNEDLHINGKNCSIKGDINECFDKTRKKRMHKAIANLIDVVLMVSVVIIYLTLGFVVDGAWGIYWWLFIVAPIFGETYKAIALKRAYSFPIVLFATAIYVLLGVYLNLWHPGWIVLLAIPLYYSIISSIQNIKKIKNSKK